ncbi:hypothetical protein W911_06200 [Hyphomicrobium nitrativorans NL23]|uniref:Uncharacterized protein n=1 Tax=Hyphomicrobium nitrativorans NL23 TaxID=1029756 RepID=V5SHQ6_9HYPH|nr:hypothetical protein W911_06200 [Hyphomicrobium nitrativorans NL23]
MYAECARTLDQHHYGAADCAFIIVPLVRGFFIDIINACIISGFISVGS